MSQSGPFQFYPVTPARVVDTRGPDGVNGGPALQANSPARSFSIQGNGGIPAGVAAVRCNLTAVNAPGSGYLTVWPSGRAQPMVATLNLYGGSPLVNESIVEVSQDPQDLSVYFAGSGSLHVAIDVVGYFAP